ncbi:MAG: hypothetical protein ABIY71_06025, partial [Flavobacteriales bacterium]
ARHFTTDRFGVNLRHLRLKPFGRRHSLSLRSWRLGGKNGSGPVSTFAAFPGHDRRERNHHDRSGF